MSPEYLKWVKGLNSISNSQQQRMSIHHSYRPNNTYNRILVDVVIIQKVVETELTPPMKQRRVNNIVMGAVLPAEDVPVLEEMARVHPDLTQTEFSSDGFTYTTKKFDINKIPTHHHERREWLNIVNDKFKERLAIREYGYFLGNGDTMAQNLIYNTPDSLDRYNSVKNTHIPGEYGSIYVYKDDFQPCHISHEQILQWQQESIDFLERLRLKQQLQAEERQREKEAIERKEREEMYREADEKIKNLNGPRDVDKYIDVF